ncbi:MAG: hypothetical protein M3O25_02605 [Actinomycetota bacterium]|nr:hypothetical protein [Actinomycetota bacterium]
MQTQAPKPQLVWQEQSAIWEIISGEIVRQHDDPIANDPDTLLELAVERAADAAQRIREGDRDSAGHALIGCALALGLAARVVVPEDTPIERYGAELAASVSWQATEPSADDVARLTQELRDRLLPGPSNGVPTVWELAIQAGSCAAGLSPYITRRRQRRDQIAAGA